MAEIDTNKIAYCQIYPGVGIARVGNSTDEFFIGPETPGEPASPVGGFKDKAGRIKRQAARFRLYAFDKDNVCLGEVTAGDQIDITWTVHLANAKPSYNTFLGRFWQSQYPNFYKYNPNETPLRNQEIMDPEQRQKLLVIDPGPRSIKPGEGPVEFDTGTIGPLPYSDKPIPSSGPDCLAGTRDGWWNCPTKDRLPTPVKMSPKQTVALGTLRVDDSGRLLVLGGYGHSDSLIPDNPIGRLMDNNYYANNDYWFDDTSDGPVSAEVRIDGKPIAVKDRAWVLVVPPKFAPAAECITTLYDTAMETWEKKQNNGTLPPRPVSFTRDIYPILMRLHSYQWLNRTVYQHHGANTNNDFGNVHSPLFALLHSKKNKEEVEAAQARQHIFERLRPPGLVAQTPHAADTPESLAYANYRFMPQMSGDGGEPATAEDPPGPINDKVYDCATEKEWPVTEPALPIPGGCYVTWLTLSDRQYVTFGTLGNLFNAMEQHLTSDTLDNRVQALIQKKAPFASQTHGEKMLGNSAINDWFLDPAGFMNELQKAGLIIPGRPEISPFFELLSFNGPMYHVFMPDEEQLLRDWCFSLAFTKDGTKPKHIIAAMDYVIDTLRQRQVGQAGHNVRITGPDPNKKNTKRTASVHEWFDMGNRALMAALANPENGWIVPFDSIASPIMSSLLAGNGDMAKDFRTIVPDSGGLTCANVFARWIDDGCPLEEEAKAMLMVERPRPAAAAARHRIYRRKDGGVWGMGTPH